MSEGGERYEIRRPIRSGGAAHVLLAYDRRLKRDVVLKLVEGDVDDAALKELKREATVLGGFRHPNIVTVHDCGVDAFELPPSGRRQTCFFVVEDPIRGHDLSTPLSMMRERPDARHLWPRRKLLRDWALGALNGLAAAHARGIIHRDIKPKNIMHDTATGQVVLIDFGLAKRVEEVGAGAAGERSSSAHRMEASSGAGFARLTPQYASPEQLRNDRGAIGPRSDLYSLGVVLYEIVCLQTPFTERNLLKLVHRVLEEEAPAAESAPPALAAIIARCLRRDPAERYPDAEALKRDLIQYLVSEAPLGLLRRWKKGDVIVREGERGDELFYLHLGRAGIEREGREVRTLGPGEWIGFAPLIQAPRSATVRALEDCEAFVFTGMTDERTLFKAIADDPAMGVSLIQALARAFAARA